MGRILMVVAAWVVGGAVLVAQEGGDGGKGKEGGKGKDGGAARSAPKPSSLAFGQIDANGDGQISKVEWLTFFSKLDTNKDGVITTEEADGAAPPPAGEGGSKKKTGDGEKKSGKGDGR